MEDPSETFIAHPDDLILVTGASGFIGSRLVENLLQRGFRNARCLTRSSSGAGKLEMLAERYRGTAQVDVFAGNLLSPADCDAATRGATLIYHLAAARGEKSFADAFMNSVVTTRNLLDAACSHQCLRRFVNVSSFAVYSNEQKSPGSRLGESSPIEERPALRGDAYCFAKAKQEQIVKQYGEKFGIPYVIVRPGHVYGPGNEGITGRVGIGTFGVFLHLGGPNPIPLTYVDNCAEAIVLAGLKKSCESGSVFNVVDDDLPSSRRFLRQYKKNVRRFSSLYVPHFASYVLCYLWEKYSEWSKGQLEPVFNRRRWRANWKRTTYSNQKLKGVLGWTPRISTSEGLQSYFAACRTEGRNA